MRLLVDTHVLIWVAGGHDLGVQAEAAYRNLENELVWSAASYWEILSAEGKAAQTTGDESCFENPC